MIRDFEQELIQACAWIENHPIIASALIWPFVSGVFNFFFKPRTPEAYSMIAKFSPRLAAFLQLMGALGFDGVKAAATIKKMAKGVVEARSSVKPPPMPPPPSIPFVLIVFGALTLGALNEACFLSPNQQSTLVDILANKIKCAIINQEKSNEEILKTCAVEPGDVPRVIDALTESRKAAKAAVERSKQTLTPDSDAGVK